MAPAAAPTVDHISIDRGQSVDSNGTVFYNQWVYADCTVTGGLDTIILACFQYPGSDGKLDSDGKVVQKFREMNPEAFEVLPSGQIRVEMYDANTTDPPPAGPYRVTICTTESPDADGELTTPSIPAVATAAPTLVSPNPNNGYTLDTVPTLSWTDGLAGSDLWLWVMDGATNAGLWYYAADGAGGGDGSVVYDQDGTASPPSLTLGNSYWWQLGNSKVEEENSTPEVTVKTVHVATGRFTVGTPPPPIQITRFGVGSVKVQDEFGGVSYHPALSFEYEEGAGWDQISSATITEPSGTQHILYPPGAITKWDSPTSGYGWWTGSEQPTPPSGTWSLVVYGKDLTSDTVSVDLPPGAEEACPTLTSPVEGDVIHDFAPLLSWTDSAPAGAFDAAFVSEEGVEQDIWGSCSMAADVNSAVYEPNGYLDFVPLEPNHSYFWRACSVWDVTPAGSDPRVSAYYTAARKGRFTEYGDWSTTPPALPGKLLYTTYTAGHRTDYSRPDQSRWMLAGYSSDPNDRTWFSPSGWYAGRWSPDGSKLAFLFSNDWTVGAAKADGTNAARLPSGQESDMPPVWMPDGNHLVLLHRDYLDNGDCPAELREVSLTESGSRTITAGPNGHICDAAVSPDGQWIAYQTDESTDSGLRLIHPDGTGDHALLVTGCSEPSYSTPAVGAAAWSPDGRKLAVSYAAWDGDSEVNGIGVIDAAGGVLTILFTVPEFYGCCGWPMHVTWSPDGTQLVFATDNHLGSQPTATPDGLPDMDLYLINADGTGGLTRLTEDYSGDLYPSWWAPNTMPDSGGSATVTVGDTTVTFSGVSAGGTTTVTVLDAPPAPAPGQFTFLGTYYDVTSSASFGLVTISMHYEDADVPAGTPEAALQLLHWDGTKWVDITTSVDTVNNVITGQCTSLSPFAIAAGPITIVGPLQPINADGSSIFKQRSAVPVKFKLLDGAGNSIPDQVATLALTSVSSNVSSGSLEAVVDAVADSGLTFHYDADAKQYLYNLKGLSQGTWTLHIEVCGISKDCQIKILK